MTAGQKHFAAVIGVLLLLLAPGLAHGYARGKVVDYYTKLPVQGAVITAGGEVTVTDDKGFFTMHVPAASVGVRASGYLRAEQPLTSTFFPSTVQIHLVPFTPKALYLTVYGIGSKIIRNSALKLIQETEINSMVIDIKGDRGIIPFRTSIPLAAEIGAQNIITVKDMKGLVRSLKEKGIYLIARIVVFKDNPLALAHPELAVRTQGGGIWKDREGLAWVNPSRKEVWDYNISIAEEAARYGFDEIQFDYVRFPDMKGLVFSVQNTEGERVRAIAGFLSEAKKRLSQYNVFLTADIFGYVCWNLNDTMIGQRLEDVVSILEYVCPMLYPSGFQFGIPGYRNPVANPHEIVYLTLQHARERSRVPSFRFRPWLQAFRDYAFDKRPFTGKEIREQIDAAEKFGSHGWMLWNPRNSYSDEGLKKRGGAQIARAM